ncbi:MAG: cytochrome c, partial [Thermoanaerobaculum sp.]|nr:cytochrome c [Thermoanaerobaculum sp.]
DGTTVKVDEAYLRESIVEPNKKIVAGYQPSMPAYSYLKEEDIKALIAYIKSLKDEKPEFVKSEAASAN